MRVCISILFNVPAGLPEAVDWAGEVLAALSGEHAPVTPTVPVKHQHNIVYYSTHMQKFAHA